MVVVEPMFPPESVVTTLPAAIVTGVQELGMTPEPFQVLGSLHPPLWTDVSRPISDCRSGRPHDLGG